MMKRLILSVVLFAIASPCFSDSGAAYWFCTGGLRATMGTHSAALDGLDGIDMIATQQGKWMAGSYRVNGVDNWDGDTGFYRMDMRAPLAPGETKTWTFYIWAREYTTVDFWIVWYLDQYADPLLAGRMEYIQKPEGVAGGPEVGTVWTTPPMLIQLPLYITDDGLTGHAFQFTMTMVPEPGSLLVLAGGLAGLSGLVVRRRIR